MGGREKERGVKRERGLSLCLFVERSCASISRVSTFWNCEEREGELFGRERERERGEERERGIVWEGERKREG